MKRIPFWRNLIIVRQTVLLILLVNGTICFYYLFHASSYGLESGSRRQYDDRVAPPKVQRRPRILCAIMTMPVNHMLKARAVRDTWAKRCDLAIFFTSLEDPIVFSNSSVVLDISDVWDNLWEKTRTAFLYIAQYYANDFDWFLKSDDDTYFIMENLRDLLSTYNASQKLLIGCGLTHEDKDSKIVFPSGGAGYVLSRGALTAFANKVQSEKPSSKDNDDSDPPKPRGCGLDGGSLGEDLRLAICMRTVGVKFIDGQHPNGTFRFLPSMLEYFVFPDRMGAISWLADQRQFVQGIDDCCSSRLVSVHYTGPTLMYAFEFLIYRLRIGNAGMRVM